jgi:hypothetical protein
MENQVQGAFPVVLMGDLPPDKPRKQQEYKRAKNKGRENGPSGNMPGAELGVAYYFDIFVQSPINRRQK